MKKLKAFCLILLVVISFSGCNTIKSSPEIDRVTNSSIDIPVGQDTPNYQIVNENKVVLSSFNFEIPDDLALLSDTVNPIVENSDKTFQLMIEDKTDSVTDYQEYVNSTHSRYKTTGIDISNTESISLENLSATRFTINTKDEENIDVTMIFYFIEQDDLKIDAIIMLKGKKVKDYSEFDNYIATIKFSKN